MNNINEDKLSTTIIDLGAARRGGLNESFLAMFGWWTKFLLKKMFGEDIVAPITLKGKKTDISSFYQTLSREKKYMEHYMDHGLNDPRTIKNRALLDKSVAQFERKTGLKWPFE